MKRITAILERIGGLDWSHGPPSLASLEAAEDEAQAIRDDRRDPLGAGVVLLLNALKAWRRAWDDGDAGAADDAASVAQAAADLISGFIEAGG